MLVYFAENNEVNKQQKKKERERACSRQLFIKTIMK